MTGLEEATEDPTLAAALFNSAYLAYDTARARLRE